VLTFWDSVSTLGRRVIPTWGREYHNKINCQDGSPWGHGRAGGYGSAPDYGSTGKDGIRARGSVRKRDSSRKGDCGPRRYGGRAGDGSMGKHGSRTGHSLTRRDGIRRWHCGTRRDSSLTGHRVRSGAGRLLLKYESSFDFSVGELHKAKRPCKPSPLNHVGLFSRAALYVP